MRMLDLKFNYLISSGMSGYLNSLFLYLVCIGFLYVTDVWGVDFFMSEPRLLCWVGLGVNVLCRNSN